MDTATIVDEVQRSGLLHDASYTPFARVTPEQALSVVQTVFGIEPVGEPVRLATERDDTFRVHASDETYLLKIAHPSDDPADIDLQMAALAHASHADPTLPLQGVVPAQDGSITPRLALPDSPARVARMLTYLPGALLRSSAPTPGRLQICGQVQARLALALADFEHPAAGRHLLFDLKNFEDLRALLPLDQSGRSDQVFTWYDEVLVPRIPDLPVQVVHSDFGLDNVLVDDTSPGYVTGILDWGDVVRTWRAADLASGLAAQVADTGPAWARPAEIVSGYQSVCPLTQAELELLPGLVAMRLTQRILMAEWLSASMPSNAEYLRRNVVSSSRQLTNLSF